MSKAGNRPRGVRLGGRMSNSAIQCNTLTQAAASAQKAAAIRRQADIERIGGERTRLMDESKEHATMAARFLLDYLADQGTDLLEMISDLDQARRTA